MVDEPTLKLHPRRPTEVVGVPARIEALINARVGQLVEWDLRSRGDRGPQAIATCHAVEELAATPDDRRGGARRIERVQSRASHELSGASPSDELPGDAHGSIPLIAGALASRGVPKSSVAPTVVPQAFGTVPAATIEADADPLVIGKGDVPCGRSHATLT